MPESWQKPLSASPPRFWCLSKAPRRFLNLAIDHLGEVLAGRKRLACEDLLQVELAAAHAQNIAPVSAQGLMQVEVARYAVTVKAIRRRQLVKKLAVGGLVGGVLAGAIWWIGRRTRRAAPGSVVLGSPTTRDLVPDINNAFDEARAVAESAAQDVKNTVRSSIKRLDGAYRGLDAIRKKMDKIYDRWPDDVDSDDDLEMLYNEMEGELGMVEPKEEEFYADLMAGTSNLLKLGRRLEKSRKRFVSLASR
jgi:hypothetical protein